jgi:hypothetical protein
MTSLNTSPDAATDLGTALGFTPEDLRQNRAGVISHRQRANLWRMTAFGFSGATFMFGLAVGLAFLREPRAIDLVVGTLFLVVAGILAVIVVREIIALRRGSVQSCEGPLEIIASERGRWQVRVGSIRWTVTREHAAPTPVVSGRCYRVFYLAHADSGFLSIEPMSNNDHGLPDVTVGHQPG